MIQIPNLKHQISNNFEFSNQGEKRGALFGSFDYSIMNWGLEFRHCDLGFASIKEVARCIY
jgi:hypothetical protein